MTPVGECITGLPIEQLKAVIPKAQSCLRKMHASGLLHGNPEAENICIAKDKVAFTGFSKASLCQDPAAHSKELSELAANLKAMVEEAEAEVNNSQDLRQMQGSFCDRKLQAGQWMLLC